MQTAFEKPTVIAKQDWRMTIVGLVLALGLFSLPFGAWINSSASLARSLAYELIIWVWIIVVLLYVIRIERRPLRSVGFRVLGIKDGLIGLAAGIVILLCLGLMYYVVFPALHWSESQQLNQISSFPYWLNVLIVVRAAVTEEILFRGYALERLEELTGSRIVAVIVSCVVFTYDHVGYWGWHHIFIAGVAGLILALLYLWRRNLWVNMIAHFVVDGAAFLL